MAYWYIYNAYEPKDARCPRCGEAFNLITGRFIGYGEDRVLFCLHCSQLPVDEGIFQKLDWSTLRRMPDVSSDFDRTEEGSES